MRIGTKEFDTANHTYVMGILNVTPDSFSDGGKWNEDEATKAHIAQMVAEGVDIIDVGGESTRPGYTFVPVEEEIARVVPVIEYIKREYDIPVSLDTYKWQVAEAGLQAGADLINDIWGLLYDDGEMARVVAKYDVAYCLMHNRKEQLEEGCDCMKTILEEMKRSIDKALTAGIKKERIILDPGVGFAKSFENNLQVIKYLEQCNDVDYPWLLGTSRKSVIGLALNLPVDERLEGTLVTTMYAAKAHWGFVRVHDVLENKRVIQMVEAIENVHE